MQQFNLTQSQGRLVLTVRPRVEKSASHAGLLPAAFAWIRKGKDGAVDQHIYTFDRSSDRVTHNSDAAGRVKDIAQVQFREDRSCTPLEYSLRLVMVDDTVVTMVITDDQLVEAAGTRIAEYVGQRLIYDTVSRHKAKPTSPAGLRPVLK